MDHSAEFRTARGRFSYLERTLGPSQPTDLFEFLPGLLQPRLISRLS